MSVPILHSRSCRENMVPTRKPPPGPMDHELAVIAVTLLTIQREARGPLASPDCCTVFGEAAGGKGASMGRKVLPECPRPRISGGPCELLSPGRLRIGGLLVVGRLRRQPFEDGLVTICLVLRARDRDKPRSRCLRARWGSVDHGWRGRHGSSRRRTRSWRGDQEACGGSSLAIRSTNRCVYSGSKSSGVRSMISSTRR